MKKGFAVSLAFMALAIALAPALAFAAESLQPGETRAYTQNEADIPPSDLSDEGYKLYVDGDSSEWLQCYVEGPSGAYTPEVKLYYEEGDSKVEVAADKYELKWQRTWYDEEQEKDCYADATLPLGIIGAGEGADYSGIGNSFVVVAVASDGSGLTGETRETHITPLDSKTFNYHAKYAYIEGAHESFVVPTWHDGFKLSPSAAAHAQVKVRDDAVNAANEELGTDTYTVTYYKRKPGPYHTEDSDYGADIWVESDEMRLDGFPTEAGTYFAVIKGQGDYFGSTVIDFDIIEDYTFTEIRLEREGDDTPLFSDSTATFHVNTGNSEGEEGADWNIIVAAGKAGSFNDETRQFEAPLVSGTDYVYDAQAKTIMLYGDEVIETLGESHPIAIRAWIAAAGDGDVLAEDVQWLNVLETRADYDFYNMHDRDMLPGWIQDINREYNVYVENGEHPDGDDFSVSITDVSSSNTDVVEVVKEYADDDESSDDYWWNLEAREYGSATITVTYRDPDELGGTVKSHTFTINVAKDVYGIDTWTESGSNRALPGTSIKLAANGQHETDYEVEEGAEEPLGFTWELVGDGANYASITPDVNDSSHATVTFRNLTDDEAQEGHFWQDIWVKVTLIGQEGSGTTVKRAETDLRLEMCSSYTELWPTRLDSRLDVGASQTITAEVRSYPGNDDAEYDVIENVSFHWEDLDASQVEIVDEDEIELDDDSIRTGKSVPFTVTRLGQEGSGFRLVAEWDDGNREERWYEFDELQFDMWLESDYDELFSDGALELRLEDDGDVDPTKVSYTVGLWEGEDDEAHWAKQFDNDVYNVSADGRTITLDGAKLLAQEGVEEFTWVRVLAELKSGDAVLSETDRWIEVRMPRADYDREWDRSMLPGWDNTVRGSYAVYVENAAHPEGEELDYTVTNVEIESQDPAEGSGDVIVNLWKDDDENCWHFQAGAHGEAVLKVTYRDLENQEQSYTFKAYVDSEVYKLEVESANGATSASPGESIELIASAEHFVENGEGNLDGVSYGWKLRDGHERFASIVPDTSNPAKATVTFSDLEEGLDYIDEEVWAEARLFTIDNGFPQERAYADICLRVTTDGGGIDPVYTWNDPAYVWASNYSTVTATRTRSDDPSIKETETVNTTAKVTKPASYTAKGETTYTATFANSAFAIQTKVVANIAQLAKLAQPMQVSVSAKTVKAKKLKKKARTIAPLKVTNAKGTVSYKVVGGKAKAKKALKVNAKTGKITVKKKTKKGTYTIMVQISATGTTQYKAGSKTVAVKVKVK